MMTLTHKIFLKITQALLFVMLAQYTFSVLADDETADDLPYVKIKHASNFSQLAEQARTQEKIILLEVSASYCEFCELLEEEFIKPMLRNNDYDVDVLIRKIDLDGTHNVIDFSGDEMSIHEFTQQFKAQFTPTLLFLDSNGNEVAPRIVGIYSLDLYGGYLDDALATGLKKIRN